MNDIPLVPSDRTLHTLPRQRAGARAVVHAERVARRALGASLALLGTAVWGTGCYDASGRGDTDAAVTPLVDAAGPRLLEERCRVAWAREIPIPDRVLGLVLSVAVADLEGSERVLASYAESNRVWLGIFDARTGEGPLEPSNVVRVTVSGARVIGATYNPALPDQRRLVTLDPRDGREQSELGTFWADDVHGFELVSIGERDILRFTVFEGFGLTSLEPQARGTDVVLTREPSGLRVWGARPGLGALVAVGDGAMLLAGPDTQLCFDGACLGAPGNRHMIAPDGTVTSRIDAERSSPARPHAAAALPDGSWLELDLRLRRFDAEGREVDSRAVPAFFNVAELAVDLAADRVVTHTKVAAGPSEPIVSNVWMPAMDRTTDLFITWDLATLTPRHFAAAGDASGRSGLSHLSLGRDGRLYAGGIADPTLEVCGRTFEGSIFVVALE